MTHYITKYRQIAVLLHTLLSSERREERGRFPKLEMGNLYSKENQRSIINTVVCTDLYELLVVKVGKTEEDDGVPFLIYGKILRLL